MTITRTIGSYHDSSHGRIRKIGQFTGPASYTTGGDPLTATDLGMGRVELLLMEPFTDGSVIILACYEVVAATVKFYDMAGAEIANGTNLSTYNARFEAIGI
jgi:hypothetical protein